MLRTPTTPALALGARLDLSLFLKLETLQRTGSFKERGALNKLLCLTEDQRKAGVIAASAGNHAQGVAYHGQRLGIPVTIVMPAETPFVKVERTERYGARVVLEGADFSASEQVAARLAGETGATLVHPYDDAEVIAGQGTIGLEMLQDCGDLDVLIVPIGGGGMIGGIATAAKALNPALTVIGVQTKAYPAMKQVLAGTPILAGGTTLAEGIAVKSPGKLTRRLVDAFVDDIVIVREAAIEQGIQMLAETQNLVAEGAGAAGIAALLTEGQRWRGKRIGTVLCGGNIDARVLSSILLRGLVRDGRLIRVRSELGDQPGTLARYATIIGKAGGNIVEVTHQRMVLEVSVKNTEIDTVIETRNQTHVAELLKQLNDAGFPTRLLDQLSG